MIKSRTPTPLVGGQGVLPGAQYEMINPFPGSTILLGTSIFQPTPYHSISPEFFRLHL
jgi:hypothetical protein